VSDSTKDLAKPVPARPGANNGLVLRRSCSCGLHTVAGDKCSGCREADSSTLRRTKQDSIEPDSVPEAVHDVLSSPGERLDSRTRAFMEPRFGRDFSNVRIHADGGAARSASAVSALAYTVGRDIVFGDGHYAPDTLEGKGLLAHELTHVAQNSGGVPDPRAPISIGPAGDRFEAEADEHARSVVFGGQPASVANAAGADSRRLSKATFTVGPAKVEINYGGLGQIPVANYQTEIESRFGSWTGANASVIHADVTKLTVYGKEWTLWALDLLQDNPVAGLNKVQAVKRILAHADSARTRPVGNTNFEFENEALAVSGWFEKAITAGLTLSSVRQSEAQKRLNPTSSSTGSSDCPASRPAAEQLDKTKLESDMPGQLKTYLGKVVVGKNTKTLPTSPLLKVADAVQQRARSFYSPYADRARGDGNTVLQRWQYSSHLVSSQSTAGTPNEKLRHDYLKSRAGIVGDTGLFSQVHFDSRCAADDAALEGIVKQMHKQSDVLNLIDPILRQKSYTTPDVPHQVVLNTEADKKTSDCDARWNAIRTLSHEVMHVMAHDDYRAAIKGRLILEEGIPEVLGHHLYNHIRKDASVKTKMEEGLPGAPCADTPSSEIGYKPAGPKAEEVRIIVKDDNFRAAFFLGQLSLAGIQPKLANDSASSDPQEREADRAAEAVVDSPPAQTEIPRSAVHRREVPDGALPLGVHALNTSPGSALDRSVRHEMESTLGHDFSDVRVHIDENAARSATAIRALAYTTGRDVVFAPGQYSPHTHAGRRLIAHELTHVVQQRGAGGSNGSTLQRKPDPKPDGGPTPKKKAPAAPTAASAPRLDLTPSKNGQACACLVVVHNDERNARKTAQLMHDNCSYNLALLEPDKPGAREVKIPGQKGTVDPNSLFPRDIAEQCMTDEKSCRDFLSSKSGTTDKDEIEKFVHIQFFLTISDCSKAFALPVVALHNNDIEDTKNYLKSKDAKGVEDLKLDVDKSKKETGADQIKKLKDLIRKKFGEDVEKETMETAGKTNIFRWCASPDLSKCHVGDPDHPDNITWVTNDKDYDTLSKQKVNVALQSEIPKSKKSESEGDLSTLFLILKELISADLTKTIEKLDKQIDLDLDEVDRVFKELEKLKEFGDLTLDAELKSIFAIISALIDALINALSKTITTAGSAARISKLRYVNIETPGKAIADQTDVERVRNYQAISAVLKSLGLHCCGDDPTKAEKNIESGLTLGGGK
jgi:Domain of unknown function (DUF4157)